MLEALRSCTRGCLTEDAGADEIERGIAAVKRGDAAIDPAVRSRTSVARTGFGRREPGTRSWVGLVAPHRHPPHTLHVSASSLFASQCTCLHQDDAELGLASICVRTRPVSG